jgi:branched-chain amino acid transport system ATP-binding protein
MSLLSLDKVSSGYGKLVILGEISLSIEQGQYLGILGPNGSGKSTLVKSIFGLTDIFAGSIKINQNELVGTPTEAISKQGLAYVPQRQNIFGSMTVRDNLLLAVRKLKRQEMQKALKDAFELFPILAERQQQIASYMSGGERQMLAIALAWLAKPQIMLLDEPSAGLAPLFVTEIFKLLRRLCETGITLVVVEQNARSLLRWCDYAYVLREGRLAFEGSSAEILADEETVKSYLGVGSATLSLKKNNPS